MDRTELARALEEHLRAQLILAEGCRGRAVAARHSRLKSAWIGHFARVSNAMAAAGSTLARVIHTPGDAANMRLVALRLPALPALPKVEGYPPPREFPKTTSGEITSKLSGLSFPFRLGAEAPSHLPRKRGRIVQIACT
jgi:hypothetical protein